MKRNNTIFSFKIILIAFIALLGNNKEVCSQITCNASAPTRVEVGQVFEYKITTNKKISKIASVKFNQFKVLGGPYESSSSYTTIINGQTTSSATYTYSYQISANQEGSLVIPASVVIIDGNSISSNNVTVIVVPPGQGGGNSNRNGNSKGNSGNSQQQSTPQISDNEVFIRGTASKATPYEGEQVILTYKLYVGNAFNGGYSVQNIKFPSQSGLWSYELGNNRKDAPRTTETVNGKKYTVFEILRESVFPQHLGQITVSTMALDFLGRVIYQTSGGNSIWDQFFGNQQAKDYNLNLKSTTIALNVKSLPEKNQPENFNGIVGKFNISSSLSRSSFKANDATNFIITVTGSGNLQHIEAPNITFPPDFDVSDPTINDKINTSDNGISGSRSFEYIIIPRIEGTFTIPEACFSFFDLGSNSYKTLSTESYQLTILKGNNNETVTSVSSNQKDIKILDKDIRFIKQKYNSFSKIKSDFFLSRWYFVLLFLPLLIFICFTVFYRQSIEKHRNITVYKGKRATKEATKRLKNARKLLLKEDNDAFYIEISKVLWGYMSDKFHIPLSQLSIDSVKEKLINKSISENSISEFIGTLDKCEFNRFAPGDASQNRQEMYSLTREFITKIEQG